MFNQKKNYMKDFHSLQIVSPSRWLDSRVRQSFLKNKILSVIHNGIDTKNIFYPRQSSHLISKYNLAGKKIILAVAPNIMDERKGGGWILKLAEQFGDEYSFIMIGLERELSNPPKNIISICRTDNQVNLAEYYSMADIFLICSKRENFPTTCLEALACGTPVIGFEEGGTAETAPTPYGHFVPYGDLNGLKRLIYGFYSGEVNYKSSQECRHFAVSNYSKESMYKSYLNLYKQSKN
jgi:glycosyltransferase involved in cell wall biosynthesis